MHSEYTRLKVNSGGRAGLFFHFDRKITPHLTLMPTPVIRPTSRNTIDDHDEPT